VNYGVLNQINYIVLYCKFLMHSVLGCCGKGLISFNISVCRHFSTTQIVHKPRGADFLLNALIWHWQHIVLFVSLFYFAIKVEFFLFIEKVHGRIICSVPHSANTVQYIAFSPDDSLIAVSADKLVHIIDIKVLTCGVVVKYIC